MRTQEHRENVVSTAIKICFAPIKYEFYPTLLQLNLTIQQCTFERIGTFHHSARTLILIFNLSPVVSLLKTIIIF